MKIDLRGKNLNITDDISEEVEKKFSRLDKYFKEEQELDVKLSKEGNEFVAETTAMLGGGTILRAEASDETIYNAIDRVMDALVKQVNKYKTRLRKDRHQASIRFESFDNNIDESSDEKELTIKRDKTISVKPMSTEEAILQMELVDHDFFVYLDDIDGDVNVVYKRKKGDYGRIRARK